MSETRWEEITEGDNEGGHVGYQVRCPAPEGAKCHGHPPHGHICLCSNEGLTATVPFPAVSQRGVHRVLAYELEHGHISDEERLAIVQLPEVCALPYDLQPHEKVILEDLTKLAAFTEYAYHGF